MKYAILIAGLLGAGFFMYSVYAFIMQPQQFKSIAYIFLSLAIIFFVLVVIKKVREEKEYRNKISYREKEKFRE